jgi:hypothetical protein
MEIEYKLSYAIDKFYNTPYVKVMFGDKETWFNERGNTNVFSFLCLLIPTRTHCKKYAGVIEKDFIGIYNKPFGRDDLRCADQYKYSPSMIIEELKKMDMSALTKKEKDTITHITDAAHVIWAKMLTSRVKAMFSAVEVKKNIENIRRIHSSMNEYDEEIFSTAYPEIASTVKKIRIEESHE